MHAGYDFHCHTSASDGTLSPAELVARAAAQGVQWLAITDHDTLDGLQQARADAEALGVSLLAGIEVSTQWQERELHVVGLGFDPDHDAVQALVAAQQQARTDRARTMGQRLDRAAGLSGSYERACALAGTAAPGRPWFARMLVAAERVRDERHAFNRFLKQGQSAFVRTPWVRLEDCVQALREAGGVAVLAHPVQYGMTRRKLRQVLADFVSAGGEGLEVAMPRLSPPQQALLLECLRDFPLLASGGSDFHSPQQVWLELGRLPSLPDGARPIWTHPSLAVQAPMTWAAAL